VVSLAGTPYLRFTVPYGSPVGVLKAIFKEIGAFFREKFIIFKFQFNCKPGNSFFAAQTASCNNGPSQGHSECNRV